MTPSGGLPPAVAESKGPTALLGAARRRDSIGRAMSVIGAVASVWWVGPLLTRCSVIPVPLAFWCLPRSFGTGERASGRALFFCPIGKGSLMGKVSVAIRNCPVVANKCDQLGKECLAATLLRDSEVPRILNWVRELGHLHSSP